MLNMDKPEPSRVRQAMKPSIFDFRHYRDYLSAVLQPQGSYSGAHSLESTAKKLGYKSASSISMVLSGDRAPTPQFISNFAQQFNLTGEERKYLTVLVMMDIAEKKGLDPRPFIDQLEALGRGRDCQVLDLNTFKWVSQWHFVALKQILASEMENQDSQSLANALKGRVTPTQVDEAIAIMLELGFLRRDGDGQILVSGKPWRTEKNVSSYAIRLFHKGMMEQALYSLENEEIHERFFSGVTLRFSSRFQSSAIKDIENFLEYFNEKYSVDRADQVKQLSIQFFNLAHLEGGKDNEN